MASSMSFLSGWPSSTFDRILLGMTGTGIVSLYVLVEVQYQQFCFFLAVPAA